MFMFMCVCFATIVTIEQIFAIAQQPKSDIVVVVVVATSTTKIRLDYFLM